MFLSIIAIPGKNRKPFILICGQKCAPERIRFPGLPIRVHRQTSLPAGTDPPPGPAPKKERQNAHDSVLKCRAICNKIRFVRWIVSWNGKRRAFSPGGTPGLPHGRDRPAAEKEVLPMKTKRSLCLLLCFLLAFSLLPGLALPVRAEDEYAGTCGEGLRWTLDSFGTLTVFLEEEDSDPREMDDYSETEHAPWYDMREDIFYVTVEEGVAYLGSYAFDGCSSLEYVFLPDSLEWIGSCVFRHCDSLGVIEVNSGNTSFYNEDGVLLGDSCVFRYPPAREEPYYCIPEDICSSIMTGAFEGAKHLERLYIPEVSDISFPVFAGCDSLTKLYLGGDAECMYGWEEELRADLPREDVSFFYNATAEDCVNGTDGNSCGENVSWKVGDGTLTISGTGPMADYEEYDEEGVFYSYAPPWWKWNPKEDEDTNKEQITRLVVEEGVTTLGKGTFRELSNLKTVSLPTTLTAIGEDAFWSTGLEEISIPAGVTIIDTYAFAETGLQEIVFPANLKTIGKWAFYNVPLKRVDIPASVTSIGERAFYDCLSLAEFKVDAANTAYKSVDGALFSKDGTEMISYGAGHTASSYTVPDGVKKLHPSTFSYTEALEKVLLPDSLEEIGNWAFGHTGVKSLLVPPHVKTIEFNAFGGCENLASVTLPARLTALGDRAFEDSKALTDIYFEGTEEQWAALTKGHEETLEGITIHYRFDAYCPHEKLIHRPAVPHGCLTDGTIEHWECEACGGCFGDAEAKKWLDDLRDPAGHDYRSAVTLAPTCSETGIRTWTCTVCDEGTEGHSYTQTIPATRRHHFVDGFCDNLRQDGVTPCGAPEQIAAGEIEGGFTWSIDSEGTLHIRGSGDLPRNYFSWTSYGFSTDAPWFNYRDGKILALRIHSGITSVDVASFAGLQDMKAIYVPKSLQTVGFMAFFECSGLNDVYYEGTSEEWSSITFTAANITSFANPANPNTMIRIVDYIGRARKHFEFDPDRTYTVTWRNADGTVLETDEGVRPGEEPIYDGETPTKEPTAQYAYVFEGWTPEPVSVTEDAVFTARYRQELRTGITAVSAGEGTAPGKLPAAAESFTVEATATLPDGLVTDDRVRICMVSYDSRGRFLKMESAALSGVGPNTYTAKAEIEDGGSVATLKIFILDKGSWDPLADSQKLEK